MVKDGKVQGSGFPKDVREGLATRMFSRSNLHRLLGRSSRVPKGCRKLAQTLNFRDFEGLLRERMMTWSSYSSSLSSKWEDIHPRIESLYRLFKSVQTRGGWRTMLGLGLWSDLEKTLGVDQARTTYEQCLSILDPDLHPTAVPTVEYFPPSRLAKWKEVLAVSVPHSEVEIKRICALDVCIFRKVAEVGQHSLQTWVSLLHFTPIPRTEAAAEITHDPKPIHNSLNLGVPLLLFNHSHKPCSVQIHAEAVSSLTAQAQLVLPAQRYFVVLNPSDILLVQGLNCATLTGNKSEVTRLSCLPGQGASLLQVLERANLSTLLKLEVPFPAFTLISELLLLRKSSFTDEERYQLAVKLMSLVGDWSEPNLECAPALLCSLCRKELFLLAWTCTCGSTLCPFCKEVVST